MALDLHALPVHMAAAAADSTALLVAMGGAAVAGGHCGLEHVAETDEHWALHVVAAVVTAANADPV